MITLSQTKLLVSSFLKEACNFLKIDECNIRTTYVPAVEHNNGIPQKSYLTKDGTIVLSEELLKYCVRRNHSILLRDEVYCKSRMFKKQSENPNKFDQFCNSTIIDAKGFSYALQSIKGLTIPVSEKLHEELYINKAKEILLSELGLHVTYK